MEEANIKSYGIDSIRYQAVIIWNKLQNNIASNNIVSSRASFTSWGEGASLALVGHSSTDVITIKMPYGVDVLH